MKYFYAIVHKDPDSAFGVQFPDLPGCFSAADDIADIVPNACEALALYFEDSDEIAPSSIDQVREMAADDIDDGAFIMAVPWITTSTRSPA